MDYSEYAEGNVTKDELVELMNVNTNTIINAATDKPNITVSEENNVVRLQVTGPFDEEGVEEPEPENPILELQKDTEIHLTDTHLPWLRYALSEDTRLDIVDVYRFNWQMIDVDGIRQRFQGVDLHSKKEMVMQLYYEFSNEDLVGLKIDPRVKLMDGEQLYQRLSIVGILKRIDVKTDYSSRAEPTKPGKTDEDRAQFLASIENEEELSRIIADILHKKPSIRQQVLDQVFRTMTNREFGKFSKTKEYIGSLVTGLFNRIPS